MHKEDINEILDEIAELHVRLENAVIRMWREGQAVSWNHHGYIQHGHIVEAWSWNNYVKAKVKNQKTMKEYIVNYSRGEGFYS